MTTVDHLRPDDDIYDPDDVGQHSPPFKPVKFNLAPSPSPPPTVPIPSDSPESSPGSPSRKGPSRPKYHPSQGDAVLVSFMAGGKHSDIARDAGQQPLASDNEATEDQPMKGGVAVTVEEKEEEDDDDDEVVTEDEEMTEKEVAEDEVQVSKEAEKETPATNATTNTTEVPAAEEGRSYLTALAAGALAHTEDVTAEVPQKQAATDGGSASKASPPQPEADAMEGVKPTIPSITTLYVDGEGARSPDEAAIKREGPAAPVGPGELPPILHTIAQSGLTNGNGSSQITLPSISDQLGDINHLPEPPSASNSAFSQSPPGRPPPQFAAVPGHGSPPKSPNDTFPRRELPSPGRGHFYSFANHHRRPSQTEGHQYTSPDYSSSNTETPSTDQSGSTPAIMGIDRMSIDGITNPQIGGFQCTYPGCTAQPFQTQYLLNSHANVHSSNRPHYCSVKGCPRSEGGKGFKRKNEMIRHGLVHDSPGYVCPFCPDREHKYPRPDNLQRHVRVHHVDKDKDDPQLREVLSQRPEGPSRGRRRRGGTS
ncbi:uncharacterized protein LY89DRAFT_687654 [Mollisia scopiformis]|uniref:C2H2-type domain-containing protein n=1 Tax=Mollisia scopiformis TaxID=149040 RepID=A0A194WYC7_MOLSC|nr:uncharacterized protein LY89DRAFT_687654 [Mollisia scopiformis]KUJ12684.1 hypothetical protein LY89DRAFT_687654 [Mollisia scopiformis]